ncbi:MAG: M14 family metallopeptidase [Anaerolineales bacterium]|nr:M14 family metallopeptidase [Anaerolineales bacterium]
MEFNRYFTNKELEASIKDWIGTYPHLISRAELGKTNEGRPIWLLTITNQETGPDTEKPAVWIDANIHATEIAGTTTSMSLAYTLLNQYGEDEQITKLVDASVYYIGPRVNPDGAELAMGEIPEYVRSGVRPYPHVDKEEGLHSKDIDNDGRILTMRIADPNGDWKISSLDPRLMERRKPDEQGGDYYRLLPEGYIEDYDGHQISIAKPHRGLDFNRNFPVEWRPESEQRGAGPYPTSEVEIKAIVDFIVQHPNINAAITYHTYSGAILRPPSVHSEEEMDASDLWVYKAIGKRGTDLVGYPNVSVYHDFRYHPKQVISGVFDEWMYNHLGIFSFTVEQWDIVSKAGIKDRKFIDWMRDHPHEDDLKILEWADQNAGNDAYVDWYDFDHPQLGKIEIGGWNNMYTWRNPPHNFMGEEAERNVPFALSLGRMLPHLEIHALKIAKVANDTFTINLVVDNSGFFPTHTSNQGKNRNVIRQVFVEIELPQGCKILTGQEKTKVGHLEGRSNKISSIFTVASPTDNRTRLEWTVKAPPGTNGAIHINSDRAGTIHRDIILE